ncbi:MAG: HD domain-containing phosphohydrolase [Pseudomonadota bacterium]
MKSKIRKVRRVSLTQDEIEDLHAIGAALAAERDLDRLLSQILEKCRRIVRADAGTLFLAERAGGEEELSGLRFKLAQNDSVPLRLGEFVIPINKKSIAGYVATTGETLRLPDVYHIAETYPFRFNPEVDRETGYRSKSVLAIPMTDHREQLIGVVQLWNKKKKSSVVTFTSADQKLVASLSAQAAVAIENAKLYAEIRQLFKGFIRASATAIEARDPSTRGHSERVAVLTVALAEEVNRTPTGRLQAYQFTPEQIIEIEYATLLHDFGKIGVRENILTKSKKLFDWELALIRERLGAWYREAELAVERRKSEHLASGGKPGDAGWSQIEALSEASLTEIREIEGLILQCNEPTVMPEKVGAELSRLAEIYVTHPDGEKVRIVSDEQIRRLRIPRGSLSDEERRQIESHVTHSFEFLSKIPWTRDLKGIPEIAHGHHEKLDGTGYPRGIPMEQIPFAARMMAIADIFDALAARDRPYKKAVPAERALDILRMEAAEGKLDIDLVNLFIERKVYERTPS